jgi:hypothetical protein
MLTISKSVTDLDANTINTTNNQLKHEGSRAGHQLQSNCVSVFQSKALSFL